MRGSHTHTHTRASCMPAANCARQRFWPTPPHRPGNNHSKTGGLLRAAAAERPKIGTHHLQSPPHTGREFSLLLQQTHTHTHTRVETHKTSGGSCIILQDREEKKRHLQSVCRRMATQSEKRQIRLSQSVCPPCGFETRPRPPKTGQ